MSFKRDGDDLSVLNMLRHQRVSTLLGAHIPEDEAKLLSNGRLTCTVCYHRPIFDTITMLGKHRGGKRHILELSRYLKRKEELEIMATKLEQENFLRLESLVTTRVLGVGRHEHSPAERRRSLNFSTSQPLMTLISPSDSHSPRSSKSHVRRYLKVLNRKRSLDSLVHQKRENYGETKQNEKSISPAKVEKQRIEPVQPRSEVFKTNPSLEKTDRDLSLNLSGWIKDKDGKWVKDPNAEFDSDEEGPSTIV